MLQVSQITVGKPWPSNSGLKSTTFASSLLTVFAKPPFGQILLINTVAMKPLHLARFVLAFYHQPEGRTVAIAIVRL